MGGRLYDQQMQSASKDFEQEITRLTGEMKNLRDSFSAAADSTELKELLSTMGKLAAAGNLSSDAMDAYKKAIDSRQTKQSNQETQEFMDNQFPMFQQFGAPDNGEG